MKTNKDGSCDHMIGLGCEQYEGCMEVWSSDNDEYKCPDSWNEYIKFNYCPKCGEKLK